MINLPSRVLLIGNEPSHLQARATVLEHFWAVAISPLADAVLPVFDAEVAVLCHTLPDEARDAWVSRMRPLLPGLIVVKMNGHESGPHAGADATVDVKSGPGGLVSTIYELLTERGLPSLDWSESMTLHRPVPVH